MTTLETSRPKALSLLGAAIEDLAIHKKDPSNTTVLAAASSKIRDALREDPNYLRALYYDAIVDDLLGNPFVAPPKYERVLDAVSPETPLFQEVRYNLGVAYYHRYSSEWLDKAIVQFRSVLVEARDPSLRILAQSARAQAFAMHMIPKIPTDLNKEVLLRFCVDCIADIDVVLRTRRPLFGVLMRHAVDPMVLRTAKWAAHNAGGMRRMYLSDYWLDLDSEQKRQSKENATWSRYDLLMAALADFGEAENLRRRDWANWCDIASAYMRLGTLEPEAEKKSSTFFSKAAEHLNEVIKVLRPEYPFARYELGRVYRCWGKFDQAIEILESVLAVPPDQRDVGDRRIKLELDRARRKSKDYP